MDSGWAAIIGALVGGVCSIAATIGVEAYKTHIRSRTITRAVRSEIATAMELARTRGYVEYLQSMAKTGGPAPRSLSVTFDYFPVYRASPDALSVMPSPVAAQAIRFYSFAQAFLEDAKHPAPGDVPPEAYQSTLAVLLAAEDAGSQAVRLIDEWEHSHRWWRCWSP